MINEIYNYAIKNQLSPIKNFELKDIRGHILLTENGEFIDFQCKDKSCKEKVLCPDIGSLQYAGENTSPIVTKLKYIVNITETKHNGFCKIMEIAAKEDEHLTPIHLFLNNLNNSIELQEKISTIIEELKIKTDAYFSFSIDGINIETTNSWHNWFSNYMNQTLTQNKNTSQVHSLLTGSLVQPLNEPAPQIKTPIMGAGCYVASYGNIAFMSYGLKGNENMLIGQDEALSIKAGLEFLLDKQNHHFNSNFQLIHFCDDNKIDEVINNFIEGNDDDDDLFEDDIEITQVVPTNISKNDKDKKLEMLYNIVSKGGVLDNSILNVNYHMMTITIPNSGRFYLSHYKYGNAQSLFDNIKKWYNDTEIITSFKKDDGNIIYYNKSITKLYSVFYSLLEQENASDKIKQINIEFGDNKIGLLYSIFDEKQIPKHIYNKALRRIKKTMINDKKIERIPISIIKCYLIRQQQMKGDNTIMSELNQNENNVAYNCGRLFATYESIQYKALGNLNSSIVSKYFASAQSTPALVFGRLAKLSNYHIEKLNDSSKIYMQKQLQEIAIKIPNFPKTFSTEDQGMFVLGYYHQRYNNFNTNKNNENKKEIKENE